MGEWNALQSLFKLLVGGDRKLNVRNSFSVCVCVRSAKRLP